MLRSYRRMAFVPAFLLRGVDSFALHLSAAVYTRCRSTNASTDLRLWLSPEEITASLGPGRTIASEPFSWNELKEIVVNGDPTMHSRSMEVQESYLLHSRRIKSEWNSMNDYILHSKFGFEKITKNEKFCSSPSLEQAKLEGRRESKLLRNEYPYFVCHGIEHWCLWKLGSKVEPYDLDWAKNKLVEMDRGNQGEIMSWVNPPNLQSIPDIDHAHILWLRSDDI